MSTAAQSPDLQLDELRQLAETRGWSVVREYVDLGVSGSKDRRPELDRLMADAQRGKFKIVACWKFDRFARSVRHLVLALDEFRSLGIDFVSARDSIDTSTPAGRFTFQVFAAVAELERELIRERVTAGIASARRRGKRIGRRPRDLDVDRALELRAQGASVRAVAAELGVPRSVVHRALSAPPGGRCAACGSAVLLDLHGRPRWHTAGGVVCQGTGSLLEGGAL